MKRVIKGAWLIATLMIAASCGGDKGPESCVEKCWQLLSKGEVEKAVALMDVSEQERELYQEIYREQSGGLVAAGGMVDFEVQSISEGEDEATVDAVVVLRNGQRVEANYSLVRRNGEWLLR